MKIIGGIILLKLMYIIFKPKAFGRNPKGEKKKKMKMSPNYIKGRFRNLEKTKLLTDGVTPFESVSQFFFGGGENSVPKEELPVVKTDLNTITKLTGIENYIVWFGHSSYLLRAKGKTYLVDPIFSPYASPIKGSVKRFKGTEYFEADKMPEIDCLIITHDHYDHLDYETVTKIKDRVKKVITPLGVGSHLVYWGYDENIITELDWYQESPIYNDNKVVIISTPSRHSGGRTGNKNKTLWSGYVLDIKGYKKIYLGADGCYGNHLKDIGNKYGPFDMALVENGQYNKCWKYSHMFPEDTMKSIEDLKASRILPIHNSKYKLAPHDWNEPLIEITRLNDLREKEGKKKFDILTPKIGEVVNLDNTDQKFTRWFENLNKL